MSGFLWPPWHPDETGASGFLSRRDEGMTPDELTGSGNGQVDYVYFMGIQQDRDRSSTIDRSNRLSHDVGHLAESSSKAHAAAHFRPAHLALALHFP